MTATGKPRLTAAGHVIAIPDHEALAVFCAALSGFVANSDFHGPAIQGSARAAAEFATSVVAETNALAARLLGPPAALADAERAGR